jgi:hypothetical protein
VTDSFDERTTKALSVFRATEDAPPSQAQEPAIEAMRTVFAEVPLVGMTATEVRSLLGPPHGQNTLGRQMWWDYSRHTGESGEIRRLRFEDDRVVKIEIVPTE